MGKKARKTRWRTLSIGEGPSDNESQNSDGLKGAPRGARWQAGGTNRYNSSHSTPTRHKYESNFGNGSSRWSTRGGHFYQPSAASGSTRSSSTTSETKITFNEEEYTKITTPRQDVLFKKGYLNKPKPHLQRQLTSAGNSTGDGTPDHQSADGTDCYEGDSEQFSYPRNGSTVGGVYYESGSEMYYVNRFDGYGAPMVLYDQFGNAAMCFQSPMLAPPPVVPSDFPTNRVKRYSTDSVPESTSPHNESNDPDLDREQDLEDDELFPQESTETSLESHNHKTRRRRQSSREISTATSDEEDAQEIEEITLDEETKCKYRVDAEEFVPRSHYSIPPPPPAAFVPLVSLPPPHDMFPFVLIAGPPPPAPMYPLPPPPEPEEAQITEEIDVIEQVTSTTENKQTETENLMENKENPPTAIDIAKIVSKLEQAALEQKLMEDSKETEEEVEQKPKAQELEKIKPTKVVNNKTESKLVENVRLTEAKCYSDRLKKPPNQSKTLPPCSSINNKKPIPNSPKSTGSLDKTPRCSATSHTANSNQTPAPTKSTEWISVSGKKKRKTKTNEIHNSINLAESAPIKSTLNEPKLDKPPILDDELPTLQEEQEKIDVVNESLTPSEEKPTIKPKKERTTKKSAKKRVIITDPPLIEVDLPVLLPEKVEETPKEQTEAKEKLVSFNKTDLSNLPKKVNVKVDLQKVPAEVKPSKKKKNKKPKPNTDSSKPNSDSKSPKVNKNKSETNQDVSLELDRMIQRGLYANLEHRLHPADRFLVDVALRPNSTPGGAFSMPHFGAVPFVLPTLRYHPPRPVAKTETKEDCVELEEVQEKNNVEMPRFPITKAVKEWMDRTRETTPEVEIFKRPQEIRDEFFVDYDDPDDLEDQKLCDDENDEKKKSNNSARFEGSPDLLECWEEDPALENSPTSELQEVEAAEDVLQSYESLYGRSGDYARIQNEVQTLRPPRYPRGDGSLPYRAICCTVM